MYPKIFDLTLHGEKVSRKELSLRVNSESQDGSAPECESVSPDSDLELLKSVGRSATADLNICVKSVGRSGNPESLRENKKAGSVGR